MEPAASPLGLTRLEAFLQSCAPWIVLGMIAVLLTIHLRDARASHLNPDEAYHFAVAHQRNIAQAVEMSERSAHPPLLALLLYFMIPWGTSEVFLRLPMILGHCALVWLAWRWMDRTVGRAAAFACAVLMAFAPPLLQLSVEVRHYMLMLPLVFAALTTFDRALGERSVGLMLLSGALLDLGILSDFSAVWFVAGFGAYSLWRVVARAAPRGVFVAWACGQLSAVALYGFLYFSQLAQLGKVVPPSWLRSMYFHREDSLIGYIVGNSADVFAYVFGSRLPGWIAAALFVCALWAISRKKARPLLPLLALFLVPPLANLTTSLLTEYPFGGSRHSVVHALVVLPAAALGLAWLVRGRILALAAILCGLGVLVFRFAIQDPLALDPQAAKRDYAVSSVRHLRDVVSPRALVLTDYESMLTLCYYYDPRQYCLGPDETRTPPYDSPDGVPMVPGEGHFNDVPFEGLHIVSSRRYWLDPANLAEEWAQFEREYRPGPDVDVWFYDAGWGAPLYTSVQDPGALPGLTTFGPKIGVFRLR